MRDPRERLEDILDAIAKIERYAAQKREAFKQDELKGRGVVHWLSCTEPDTCGRIWWKVLSLGNQSRPLEPHRLGRSQGWSSQAVQGNRLGSKLMKKAACEPNLDLQLQGAGRGSTHRLSLGS